MNINFIEVMKYFIPLLAIILLVYLFLDSWRKQEIVRFNFQLNKELKKNILPLKIQAFERMVLFLERINLNNLVLRLNNSNLNAKEFQFVLIDEITKEFEHNQSQQLYINTKTWERIRLSKDYVIQCISTSSSNLSSQATSKDLAISILNLNNSHKGNDPIVETIEMLKLDFKNIHL